MSSGRRTGPAGAALVLASAGLVALAMLVDGPRPVDARRVDPRPAGPAEVLSATFTTTVQVARSTTPVVVVAPPPRPEPPAPPPPPEPRPVEETPAEQPPAPPDRPPPPGP
ncbi:hypothetical protein NUG22_15855, partial [Saccharothrix longispora]|nr:hypothetical protein [Saccharothrix longispora]